MKYLIAVFLLSSCNNDAVTFAQSIDPTAQCTKINTSWSGTSDDVAVCRVGTEIWLCTVNSHSSLPDCKKVRDVPLERK